MIYIILAILMAAVAYGLCHAALPTLMAFLISLAAAPMLMPILHELKFGQAIREEGPAWHRKKSGTPTMGGIIFILSVLITGLIVLHRDFKGIMLIYLSMAFGIIGFVDDYIKVVKKRNLGLTEIQKLIMQIVASVLFVYLLYTNGFMKTTLVIPFTGISWDMGIWYFPFAVLVILAAVNAVNLTDGIDGLAGSVTVVVSLLFAAVCARIGDNSGSVFSCITAGALMGFLLFNKHPARIFMGDTGSLFLGGCLAAVAVSNGLALVLIIAGGIYVIETLSVIIQVVSFKLTKKRIFKMSPIHHHFEMCGWSENKIVNVFVLISVILCVAAYFGGVL